MLRSVLTISLLSSFSLILYQRIHINNLTHELSSISYSHRSKRSISIETKTVKEEEEEDEKGDNSISFPLYAQISRKAMLKLCHEHRRGKKENVNKRKRMKEKRKSEEKIKENKKMERKKCSQHVSFSSPRLVSRRSHLNGCALRNSETWFVCEFHMGYTMLEYADTSSLTASLPRALHTLPFPYEGTDGAAINGSVVYSHDDQLILHNFATSKTHRLSFNNINRDVIYNGSFSRMDIQSDEHGLWVLYREKEKETLTVSRVSIPSLKLLHTWALPLHPSQFCNSFIRCAILYSISCGSTSATIQPVYDFYSALPIVGKATTMSGIREYINSAQYDAVSQSLSIFSRGLIYSISIDDSPPPSP